MDVEAELGDVGSKKSQPSHRWFWLWVWCVLFSPLLALTCQHLLATGSPVPLWWSQPLNHPVQVAGCTDQALILADGRHLRLPFLRRLPCQDAVFIEVLKHGVEVRDGEVYGLITEYGVCGLDPYCMHTHSMDLSALAGVLDPTAIDPTRVDLETFPDLWKVEDRGVDRHGLPPNFRRRTHNMKLLFNFSAARQPPGGADPPPNSH